MTETQRNIGEREREGREKEKISPLIPRKFSQKAK